MVSTHSTTAQKWYLAWTVCTVETSLQVAKKIIVFLEDPPGPAIRLANGTDPCEGRVEVWNHTDWGSVCDDGWDVKAGDVVCAQLDCGSAHKVTGEGGPFPSGSGHILLDELNCTGSEKDLWQCVTPRTGQTHDCGHKEDAGVVCTGRLL